MMNVILNGQDIINMMTAKGAVITDSQVAKNEAYQKELKTAQDHNTKWDAIHDGYVKLGIADPALEAITTTTAGGPRIDERAILNKYREAMQAEENKKAVAEKVTALELGVETLTAMGIIPAAQPQVISAPAPSVPAAPAPSVPTAPDESRMIMAERKAMIRDMVGSGTGTNQFRRHCDTTAQANVARAKIEEWRSKGYISGTQKAELRAEVNAAAWLGHCGVTATR